MKVNIEADENNTIIQWKSYPLDEETAVEIEDPYSIHLGVDKFIDGALVRDDEAYRKTLETNRKARRIQELRKRLDDTDYLLFKHLEGLISDGDYESIRVQRQSYRDEINQLEGEME